jgi:hypothetical protein
VAKSAIATKSAVIARNKAAVAKTKVAASKAATGKADAKLSFIIAMNERRETTPAVYLRISPG